MSSHLSDLKWWSILDENMFNWNIDGTEEQILSQVIKFNKHRLSESLHLRIDNIAENDWNPLRQRLYKKLAEGYALEDNCDYEENVVFVKISSMAHQLAVSELCVLIHSLFQKEYAKRNGTSTNRQQLMVEPSTRYKMLDKNQYYSHDSGITNLQRSNHGQLPLVLIEVGIFQEDISFANKCKMWIKLGEKLHRDGVSTDKGAVKKPKVCIGINLMTLQSDLIGLSIHYFSFQHKNTQSEPIRNFDRCIRVYGEDIDIDSVNLELAIPYSDLCDDREELGSVGDVNNQQDDYLVIPSDQLKSYYKIIKQTIKEATHQDLSHLKLSKLSI